MCVAFDIFLSMIFPFLETKKKKGGAPSLIQMLCEINNMNIVVGRILRWPPKFPTEVYLHHIILLPQMWTEFMNTVHYIKLSYQTGVRDSSATLEDV